VNEAGKPTTPADGASTSGAPGEPEAALTIGPEMSVPAAPGPSVQRRVKGLTKDSMVYGLGMAGQKLVGLILLPVLTRIFEPAEYGAITLITLLMLMASYFVVMGNDTALLRFYHDTTDESERRRVAALGFGFRAAASLVLALALLPFSGAVSRLIFGSNAYASYIFLSILNLPFATAVKFYIDLLRVRLRPGEFAALSLGNLGLIAALTIWMCPGVIDVEVPIIGGHVMLAGRDMGMLGVFAARLAADVVFTVVGLIWTFRDYMRPRSFQPLVDMLRFGLPLVPVGIAQWVLAYADRFMLKEFVSLDQVGPYEVGAKVSSFMMLFVAAFQYAWGPFAISIWREANARATYAKVFSLYIFVAGLIGLLVTGLAREFLQLVTTGHYVHGYRISGFLVFAAMAHGAFYVPASGLQIVKRTAWMGAAAMIGAGLNIVLNLLLAGPFEVFGVATATLISQIVATLILFAVAQRCYPVPYQVVRTGLAFTWALGLAAVSIYVGRTGPTAALVATVSSAILYLAGCLAFGVLQMRDFEVLFTYARRRLVERRAGEEAP
jgi:O-antigen/teichoic acid export membrane protein